MKTAVLFLCFLALISTAYAEEETIGVDASVSVYSQYVGCLSGEVSFDRPVIQPSFTISHNPTGLYANVWASYSPKGGFDSDYGDEADYTLGLNRDIAAFNVDIYYAYYNIFELDKHSDGDMYAMGLKVKFPGLWEINPYAQVEYDLIRGDSELNGLLYKVGIDFDPIEKLKVDLSAGGHSEIYGVRSEAVSYGRLTVAYQLSLTENITLSPEISFQKRLGSDEGLTEDVIWGGVTLSCTF